MPRDVLVDALARKAIYGLRGKAIGRPVASAPGWSAVDVVCTSGPKDKVFEERHPGVSVALVVAGSFSYRCEQPRQVMTPGSLLLGNAMRPYHCGHEHGEGDRCLSFHFEPALVESVAADLGLRQMTFTTDRIAPCRGLSSLSARGRLLLDKQGSCEEFALELIAFALTEANRPQPPAVSTRHERAVSDIARYIEHNSHQPLTLATLAKMAGLSPYHFLRIFDATVGTTPHQFLARTRLRAAANRLSAESSSIASVAYESGYDDLPNFIRAFHREFGQAPSQWRADRERWNAKRRK